VFLQVLGAGALVASCADEAAPKPTGRFQVGTKADLPMAGSFKVSDTQAVVVFRDAGGLYAMTMVCTHEQCDIRMSGTVTATEITCTCHGSKFDANGAVKQAPATSPLEHFQVDLQMTGEIFVNADVTVPAATRVVVA
jgi:cytochrome b6-f complex iron-sulfur subunit